MRNLTTTLLLLSFSLLLLSGCIRDEDKYCNIFSVVNNSEDTILYTRDFANYKKVTDIGCTFTLSPHKADCDCVCYYTDKYNFFYYFIRKSKVDEAKGNDFSSLQWDTIIEVKRYEMQLPGFQIIYSGK